MIRKRRRATNVDIDSVKGLAEKLLADQYFDGDHTQAMLQEAIASLPEVQRAVFTLRYYDNVKYSEMSKIMDTSEGALKASYHIAAKKVSEYLVDWKIVCTFADTITYLSIIDQQSK